MTSKVSHPFYPIEAELKNFIPSQLTIQETLVPFLAFVVAVILGSYVIIRSQKHSLSNNQTGSKLNFVWFVVCGFIHTGLEGYFAANALSIAGQTTYMAEMWKEYALSDSRYMTADPSVWMIESITAFLWGPLCFVTAYLIAKDHPSRHLFQFGISLGQAYGCVLYYLTTLLEGAPHCRPEAFYFWFYFVFMNIFWIVVPVMVMYSSGKVMLEALDVLQFEKTKKKKI